MLSPWGSYKPHYRNRLSELKCYKQKVKMLTELVLERILREGFNKKKYKSYGIFHTEGARFP